VHGAIEDVTPTVRSIRTCCAPATNGLPELLSVERPDPRPDDVAAIIGAVG
jgi:hypothetical protein